MARAKFLQLVAHMLTAITIGAGASASHAAIYHGAFDPLFGSPYVDLGWSGEVDFFIPNACLTSNGFNPNGSCGTMSLLAAQVDFYKFSTSSHPPLPSEIIATVPVVPGSNPVTGVFVFGANPDIAVETTFFGPAYGGASPNVTFSVAGGPSFDGRVAGLRFFGASCITDGQLLSCDPLASLQLQDFNGETFNQPFTSLNDATVTYTKLCDSDNPDDFGTGSCRYSVPEPGTLGLLLSALGVIGLARRRLNAS